MEEFMEMLEEREGNLDVRTAPHSCAPMSPVL